MKKLLCFALLAFLFSACGEPGYKITGAVSDADLNGKYIYMYEFGVRNAFPLDSALVKNNKFTFKGEQTLAAIRTLSFADGVIDMEEYLSQGGFPVFAPWFILDNSDLIVNIAVNSTVNGTPENDDLTAYMKKIDNLFDNMKVYTEAEQDKAEAEYEEATNKANSLHKEYIKAHSNSLSGAVILLNNRYSLSEDERRELLSVAGDSLKSVPGIDGIISHLAVLGKVGVGKTFTDIVMPDPKEKEVKLSDYAGKGKVVLVDFWASWCPPCRRDMPHMVEVYKQYKNKGFEIVGISLDRTGDAWRKGINDLGITWPQMSDLKYWQSEGAALYGVNSIPHTVLIDKEGIIIAKDLRGKALDAKLKELFD